MTILHYTLGMSPQRSGGLTKYATDLMSEQSKEHRVVLLYPAGYKWWSREMSWSQGESFERVETIRLVNTLPVPLLFGVKTPMDFISSRKMSKREMERLYNYTKPDVFHVHTLMGLPKELLQYFKRRGVRLIYTSHDYFGICPKVNLIDHNGDLCNEPSPKRCCVCNKHSKSTLYLRLRNSQFALNIKNNKTLRKVLR